jgi:RNA recognition motif-containing protein
MATKLYVGNLAYGTTDDSLKQAFGQAGTVVSATVVIDKMTGRSRGFGFVEMDTEDAANAAIEMFDGKEIDGRAVKVNIARPMEDRPPRRDFGGGGRGGFGGGNGGGRGGFNRGGGHGGGQDDNNSWS